MFFNNLVLTTSFLHHITHNLMEDWRFFTNTLNLLLRNFEKYPDNWNKYNNQVLVSYFVTPHLTTAEKPFLLAYGRDPNLPLDLLLELMQQFLSDPTSGHLDLKSHHLALTIAEKTVDENWFKHAQ